MARRCLSVSWPRSRSRAMKTMRAPFCASRSAATSPMPEVAPVTTTVLPCIGSLLSNNVQFAEEKADLMRRGFGRVGAVHRIGLDRFGEILADGAGRRLGRIGGAHHFAILGDGVLPLQHLHDHQPRGHEFDQALEERPRL